MHTYDDIGIGIFLNLFFYNKTVCIKMQNFVSWFVAQSIHNAECKVGPQKLGRGQ